MVRAKAEICKTVMVREDAGVGDNHKRVSSQRLC